MQQFFNGKMILILKIREENTKKVELVCHYIIKDLAVRKGYLPISCHSGPLIGLI